MDNTSIVGSVNESFNGLCDLINACSGGADALALKAILFWNEVAISMGAYTLVIPLYDPNKYGLQNLELGYVILFVVGFIGLALLGAIAQQVGLWHPEKEKK